MPASAETRRACVAGRSGRQLRIPDEFRSQFDVVTDETAVLARLDK